VSQHFASRSRRLAVVDGGSRSAAASPVSGPETAAREVDWSILMAHVQAGNGDAYRRLLREITPYLRSMAARWCRDPGETEDAVQDVLMTVHAIRHTYDPTRPFGPWLTAIANRRIVDRLRRSGRRQARETPLTHEHETFAAPGANLSERTLERRALASAIERLPAAQRQAIRLLKLEEMSLKEAATATGTSIASLKVATHRGLAALRKLLSGRNGETR